MLLLLIINTAVTLRQSDDRIAAVLLSPFFRVAFFVVVFALFNVQSYVRSAILCDTKRRMQAPHSALLANTVHVFIKQFYDRRIFSLSLCDDNKLLVDRIIDKISWCRY